MEIRKVMGPYDHPIRFEGKSGSEEEETGKTLYYGFHQSPFGKYLLATTDRGQVICLDFMVNESASQEMLQKHRVRSTLIHHQEKTDEIASRLFRPASQKPLLLMARGTPFQLKVWKCLIDIPFGKTVSYQWVAEKVGVPTGFQAIGNAMAKNPIAFLIPCHRVIRKTGQITGYAWGAGKKSAILRWENSLAGEQRTLF